MKIHELSVPLVTSFLQREIMDFPEHKRIPVENVMASLEAVILPFDRRDFRWLRIQSLSNLGVPIRTLDIDCGIANSGYLSCSLNPSSPDGGIGVCINGAD
jgi:hypothetical protein